MTTPISQAIAQAAVDAMERLWSFNITDAPEHNATVERIIIRGCHDWMLDDGAEGERFDELDDYWCGSTAAACYRRVGDFLLPDRCVDLALKEEVARFMWSSTTRLVGLGPHTWEEMAEKYGVSEPIFVEPRNARRGDLLLIGTGRTSREYGDHIDLCREAPDLETRTVEAIGGNTGGELGDGTSPEPPNEGVCANTRKLRDVRRVIRIPADWLAGEGDVAEVCGPV